MLIIFIPFGIFFILLNFLSENSNSWIPEILNFEAQQYSLNSHFFCSNKTSEKPLNSKKVENNKISIVITVLDEKDYYDYSLALDSVKCYADHYGYHVELINMTSNPRVQKKCNQPDVSVYEP